MLTTILKLTDILFPPPEVIAALRGTKKDSLHAAYRPQTITGCIVLSSYHEPLVRAAIIANKFHNYTLAASQLASLLQHHIGDYDNARTIFIPIPLSSAREKSRGYNQVTKVLKVAKLPTLPLLTRTRHTAPQTSLPRAERFDNVRDAFRPLPITISPHINHFIIVDDVVTTSATMHAAKAALLPILPPGATITLLALAH